MEQIDQLQLIRGRIKYDLPLTDAAKDFFLACVGGERWSFDATPAAIEVLRNAPTDPEMLIEAHRRGFGERSTSEPRLRVSKWKLADDLPELGLLTDETDASRPTVLFFLRSEIEAAGRSRK